MGNSLNIPNIGIKFAVNFFYLNSVSKLITLKYCLRDDFHRIQNFIINVLADFKKIKGE